MLYFVYDITGFSPCKAESGDKIILTKPLGTQLATNAKLWLTDNSENWIKISQHLTSEQINTSFELAVKSMSTLNKTAASLMHKYSAHAATDVTGFGLRGHAENLCKFQNGNVNFILHTLPIIQNVRRIGDILKRSEKLLSGNSVETSGGLLICIPANNAQHFCEDFKSLTGDTCWIVGDVVDGNKTVELISNPNFIDV